MPRRTALRVMDEPGFWEAYGHHMSAETRVTTTLGIRQFMLFRGETPAKP